MVTEIFIKIVLWPAENCLSLSYLMLVSRTDSNGYLVRRSIARRRGPDSIADCRPASWSGVQELQGVSRGVLEGGG